MEKFFKEIIGYRKVIGSPKVLRDAEFEQCYFEGGALAQHDDPTCGFVVKNVILRKCRAGRIELHGVRFEDVTVEGLTYPRLVHAAACLFERVTLRGPIGPIQTMPANYTLPAQMRAAFLEQAMKFYAGIEWALDISHAEFSSADFNYVPGNLVRRNSESQFLVHRKAALSAPQGSLPGLAAIIAERAGYSPYDTIVAVAPTRSKNAAMYRDELQVLRDRGIAE
jgi:hypothetical protein